MTTVNTPHVSKAPRGDCQGCGTDYALTKRGLIRKHGIPGVRRVGPDDDCAGALKRPRATGPGKAGA